MKRNLNMFGRTVPVWFLVAAMVGAGSLAIATSGGAVHQEDAPDIQRASDVKIHLQDVDGKIITNVPIAADRIFSPLPVVFSEDEEPSSTGDDGSQMVSKQKALLNFILDVSTETEVTFFVANESEDPQIFLIKASAPSHVILDMQDGTDVAIHGVTGHNEWLAHIEDNGLCPQNGGCSFDMEVYTTDAGFYPIVVELLRVG